MKREVLVVLSLIVLVVAFVVGTEAWRAQRSDAVQTMAAGSAELFAPAHSARLGNPDAKVVVVEFFDPACETCAQFAPILEQMVEDSGGRIQLVERYAPFHPGSEQVVAILEAARNQGRYYDALRIMFATQPQWASHTAPNMEALWSFLEQGGLDVARLRQDAQDPAILALIQQDLQDAQRLGVKATPEFFVNGKPLPSWGLRQLQELVQAELQAQYGQ